MTLLAHSFCSSSLERDLACLISLPTPLMEVRIHSAMQGTKLVVFFIQEIGAI